MGLVMVKVVKAKKEKMDCHGNKLPRNDESGKEDGLLHRSAPRNDESGGCNDKGEIFVDKFNLLAKGGRPPSFNSVEEMAKKATAYFVEQENVVIGYTKEGTKMLGQGPINIDGVCNFMGISNQTLSEYGKKKEYAHTVERIKKECATYLVNKCCTSKDHKADFVLKNNFKEDWKEETTTKLVSDEPTAERLKKFLDKKKGKKSKAEIAALRSQ